MTQEANTSPGLYYVTIHDEDSGNYSRLLGPFVDDHQAALDMVNVVRDKACELSPVQATWASFGTCRIDHGVENPPKPGVLNSYFD